MKLRPVTGSTEYDRERNKVAFLRDLRLKMTNVLNYFKQEYDENGIKIKRKKQVPKNNSDDSMDISPDSVSKDVAKSPEIQVNAEVSDSHNPNFVLAE